MFTWIIYYTLYSAKSVLLYSPAYWLVGNLATVCTVTVTQAQAHSAILAGSIFFTETLYVSPMYVPADSLSTH